MAGEVIPFVSKGKKRFSKEEIVDHGNIGSLKYEVYKRGVVHIFNDKLKFKKDAGVFEDALDKAPLADLENGEEHTIPGSGDNDTLVFKKVDGEIQISLKKRGFKLVDKLKKVLEVGKQQKEDKAACQ